MKTNGLRVICLMLYNKDEQTSIMMLIEGNE